MGRERERDMGRGRGRLGRNTRREGEGGYIERRGRDRGGRVS